MPSRPLKRSSSPPLFPPKRLNLGPSPSAAPLSQSPIMIIDDSDDEKPSRNNYQPAPFTQEEAALNLLVASARKRGEDQRMAREAEEREMTIRHAAEKQIEEQQMLALLQIKDAAEKRSREHGKTAGRIGMVKTELGVGIEGNGPAKKEPRAGAETETVNIESSPTTAKLAKDIATVDNKTRKTEKVAMQWQSDLLPRDGPSMPGKRKASENDIVGREQQDEMEAEDEVHTQRRGRFLRSCHRTHFRDSTSSSGDSDSEEKDKTYQEVRGEGNSLLATEESESASNESTTDTESETSGSNNEENKLDSALDEDESNDGDIPIQMPSYINSLNQNYHLKLPLPEKSVRFSREFLSTYIGGSQLSPHVYISPNKKTTQIYPIDRYDAFSNAWNPHAPPNAGSHGATLQIGTLDRKPEAGRKGRVSKSKEGLHHPNNRKDVGLQEAVHTFVKRGPNEWEYCGKYSQGRDYELLTVEDYHTYISKDTKVHWAKSIVKKAWGWDFLVAVGFETDHHGLWNVRAEDILELFEKPDDALGLKLRFYWQYLECVDYDENLYNALYNQGMKVGYTTKPGGGFGKNAAFPTARKGNDEDKAEGHYVTNSHARPMGNSAREEDKKRMDEVDRHEDEFNGYVFKVEDEDHDGQAKFVTFLCE
ncbi:MAG: hypothetical protein M1812_003008 [Candelaria pacifica]|nr:MAG: hypothetical protein M1812_003008 [Candelaria pacifica]